MAKKRRETFRRRGEEGIEKDRINGKRWLTEENRGSIQITGESG